MGSSSVFWQSWEASICGAGRLGSGDAEKVSVLHPPEELGLRRRPWKLGLGGDKVKLPLTFVLDREVAERLRRAIREGKKLEALVAEILEVAVR